jgi:hypothetical protein
LSSIWSAYPYAKLNDLPDDFRALDNTLEKKILK